MQESHSLLPRCLLPLVDEIKGWNLEMYPPRTIYKIDGRMLQSFSRCAKGLEKCLLRWNRDSSCPLLTKVFNSILINAA
jgi:hypothetical protein